MSRFGILYLAAVEIPVSTLERNYKIFISQQFLVCERRENLESTFCLLIC